MDDLENLYSNDMELLTIRLSDKDAIIRDLESRLYESEEFRLQISGEIAHLFILFLFNYFLQIYSERKKIHF